MRSVSKKVFPVNAKAICLLLLLVSPAISFAASGHDAHHQPSISDTFIYWSNFLAFVVILFLLIKKPFINAWHSRRKALLSGIEAGKAQLREAEEQLRTAQERISLIEKDIAALKDTISSDATTEAEQIVNTATERASRIKEQARLSIEAERKAAEQAIRRELAEMVVVKAGNKLKEGLDPEIDRRLRDAALDSFCSLAVKN